MVSVARFLVCRPSPLERSNCLVLLPCRVRGRRSTVFGKSPDLSPTQPRFPQHQTSFEQAYAQFCGREVARDRRVPQSCRGVCRLRLTSDRRRLASRRRALARRLGRVGRRGVGRTSASFSRSRSRCLAIRRFCSCDRSSEDSTRTTGGSFSNNRERRRSSMARLVSMLKRSIAFVAERFAC